MGCVTHFLEDIAIYRANIIPLLEYNCFEQGELNKYICFVMCIHITSSIWVPNRPHQLHSVHLMMTE